jgi:hypothetical protein
MVRSDGIPAAETSGGEHDLLLLAVKKDSDAGNDDLLLLLTWHQDT